MPQLNEPVGGNLGDVVQAARLPMVVLGTGATVEWFFDVWRKRRPVALALASEGWHRLAHGASRGMPFKLLFQPRRATGYLRDAR